MSNEVGPSVAIVALIGIMETVAVVKTFLPADRQIDANQEILALGLANILGSFAKAMPTSGAFSRAAVSKATRSNTMLNGLFIGIVVLITILCLTPYFYYLPQSMFCLIAIFRRTYCSIRNYSITSFDDNLQCNIFDRHQGFAKDLALE